MNIPVVNSLMAVDALQFDDPWRVGLIGSYGNRWANRALGTCDVLLVLGSRLDVRQTGADTLAFAKGRQIFHVDVDASEMNNRVVGCVTAEANLRDLLPRARAYAVANTRRPAIDWMAEITSWRTARPDTAELQAGDGINPNVLMHDLSRRATKARAFVADVGQHQMWAAQSLEIGANQRFLNSGGMGSMGYALPAAVGASFAAPGEPIVLIAGDGGFQCNIQELETVARHNLPIKMMVLDNGCHGMVRQFQESYFEKRYQSTVWGYSAPAFDRVAEAYGIVAKRIELASELGGAIDWLFSSAGPSLLHVDIAMDLNAYPKMAFGRPITEMEPDAQPIAMEST
ncbi:MAG: hypothetical protein NVSMB64_27180 [Candidatus Velthaea sp.]